MAPGANWKGFLRLSLVTCPVALYGRDRSRRADEPRAHHRTRTSGQGLMDTLIRYP